MEKVSSYFCEMQKKQWILAPPADTEIIKKLSAEINVNPILGSILVNRGIVDFNTAKSFFRPSIDDLHDPFLMQDMQPAVTRLCQALERDERILVYGDYDVDGSTSVAMMYSFLSEINDSIGFYIPDRYAEGYGISAKGIDYAIEHNYTLIISLDCGIKANDRVNYASEHGVDFIICDHHTPSAELPKAAAVLDPKRSDCNYPYKELSGCGVGFKLIQAYCLHTSLPEHRAFEYLDLVAVSIAADIVSLTGENRTLAYYGLEKINYNPRPGIKALLKSSGLNDKVVISNLVFQIGPRINAAGRIDHAHLAVELLTAKNEDEADKIAEAVSGKNTTRRDFDQQITTEALGLIEGLQERQSWKSTVLYKEDWHKGVIGIVASRCIEHYYRPTIILTKSNGTATGSARSVDGFNLYAAIEECSDLLTQFGGHTHAAGLTMPIDNIEKFQHKFDQVVRERINEEHLIPKVSIDAYLSLEQITPNFYSVLAQMDPFGPDNMQPVFASQDLEVIGVPKILKEKHLKFEVRQRNGKKKYTAIGFGLAYYAELIKKHNNFEIAYTLQENNFNNQISLQLYLKDIRLVE